MFVRDENEICLTSMEGDFKNKNHSIIKGHVKSDCSPSWYPVEPTHSVSLKIFSCYCPFQSNKNYFQNTLHFGKPEIMDYGSAFQLAYIVGSLTHLPVIAAESGKANYQLLVLFYT